MRFVSVGRDFVGKEIKKKVNRQKFYQSKPEDVLCLRKQQSMYTKHKAHIPPCDHVNFSRANKTFSLCPEEPTTYCIETGRHVCDSHRPRSGRTRVFSKHKKSE